VVWIDTELVATSVMEFVATWYRTYGLFVDPSVYEDCVTSVTGTRIASITLGTLPDPAVLYLFYQLSVVLFALRHMARAITPLLSA
jgi:hypothetical protein